jgi:hypothetical protein
MANVIRRCDPTHGAVRRRTTGLATHGQASSWSITIYMTGNEDPAIRKAALDAGCIAFLTKAILGAGTVGAAQEGSGRALNVVVRSLIACFISAA